MSPNRYRVIVYGRLLSTGATWDRPMDITHDFTSKANAERFARAIAKLLPGDCDPNSGCVLAWVLVYALPLPGRHAFTDDGYCYRSQDPGGAIYKDHSIPEGFYGATEVNSRKAA